MSDILPKKEINDHSFLAEELLIPNANKADASRLNMVDSHLSQLMVLDKTELPLVFTGFENQVGEISTGIKVAKEDLLILKVLEFHQYHKLFFVKNESNVLSVIELKYSKNLTESFGYKINTVDERLDLKAGDYIYENEIIYRNGMYDEEGNFGFGVNLDTVYLPFKGKTYEDPLVISESAAKKLGHSTVSKYQIVLNRNDVLIKGLPRVGETITDGILTYRRRITNSTILNEFTNSTFNIPLPDDTPFYATGVLTDIKVFSNIHEDLNAEYNKYLKEIEEQQSMIYRSIINFLESNKVKDLEFTDDIYYWKRKAEDYFNEELAYTFDKSQFEGIVVLVEVTDSEPCWIGSKLSGRYGNKGVVSTILPDDEMPLTVDGRRAEVVCNSLGVVGRMNIAQLYEHEINFIAAEIVKFSKDLQEFSENILKLFELISPDYYNYFNSLDDDTFFEVLSEMYENNTVYIEQKPFFNNISFDALIEVYKTFPQIKKIKFEGIQKPLVFGKMYFIKLKHESVKKLSVRSTGMTNLLNIPYKTNEKQKKGNALYNNNPIRLGEQETFNMLLLNKPELQNKFIQMYSSSNVYRKEMLIKLLNTNIKDIDSFEIENNKPIISNSTETVRAILSAIGVDINHVDIKGD
ncbi:MAG: hypothetical protein [Bacteriophage sp.]|nr:MAG: hypothetical protein [Bacteriophage sp.]